MKSKVLSCIVTGIEKRVSGNTINKQSLRFGTEEQFANHFVCREAKGLLRKRIQPEQVQEQLRPQGKRPFAIDYQALARLKLLKKSKGGKTKLSPEELKRQQEETEKNERSYHELAEKLKTCSKTYIEWATGGPNKCQVKYGGTCIRPDIFFNNEYNVKGNCAPCPYNEHCLCSSKKVLA